MESGSGGSTGFGVLLSLFRAMRPHQWVKNLFVLAPLLFASADQTTGLASVADLSSRTLGALGAALLFCLVSGAVYLLNDVCDLEADRAHPEKRLRPIASGEVSVAQALSAHAFFVLVGVGGGAWLYGYEFAIVIGGYFLSNTAYSKGLKNYAYLDVGLISSGFILRVLAGAYAIQAPVSMWLLLCTFLLALYLALGKRLHEVLTIRGEDGITRKSLKRYSSETLRWWMKFSGVLTCVAFLLYTLDPRTAEKFGHQFLALTLPNIAYGVRRFFLLAHQTDSFRSPTERMIRDKPFILNLLLWGVIVIAMLFS